MSVRRPLQLTRDDAIRALPRAYREAPVDIQRNYLNRRAGNYLLLSRLGLLLCAVLLLIILLALNTAFTVNTFALVLEVGVIAAVVAASIHLRRGSERFEALMETLTDSDTEERAHDDE
jgi:Flp pilus assembly protein TadB